MKYYAGIGSRITPQPILDEFKLIAAQLEERGFTLRSGGANGADKAFEYSTKIKEIFTHYKCTDAALEHASKFHPNWNACSYIAQKLHGRNSMIILGENLDSPVDFVICWTMNGLERGGTGQALRIAKSLNIEVLNRGSMSHTELTNRIGLINLV